MPIHNPRHAYSFAILAAAACLGACATAIPPDSLKRPDPLTCIEVPKGVEAHESKGLLNIKWTTRLAPGPYISEREDTEGTYYRAPPAGLYIGRDDLADEPPQPLMPRLFDGGIWIPRAPGKPPHLYTYFSTQEATAAPVPENASCANAVSVPDPHSQGVSTVAFVVGGAAGGAAGGAIARAVSQNSTMSYGQAAGAGAVGGAIGGAIVAGLINMDVGKIIHHAPATDPKFHSALEEFGRNVTPIPATPLQ